MESKIEGLEKDIATLYSIINRKNTKERELEEDNLLDFNINELYKPVSHSMSGSTWMSDQTLMNQL